MKRKGKLQPAMYYCHETQQPLSPPKMGVEKRIETPKHIHERTYVERKSKQLLIGNDARKA